jgi:hypothetical protein
MLHWLVGDETFRAALRRYYAQHRLQHVTESDMRAAFNGAAGESLDWFFDQWIHTTGTLDYRIGDVSVSESGGRWTTRVEVIRDGDIRMPVDLQVGESVHRLTSAEPRQLVTVTTAARPERVTLDPQNILIDVDPANNTKEIAR